MNTEVLPTGSAAELELAVERAVELLIAGEVVALPTETVYGLAADALRPEAVLKIFEAKMRPFFDPLIVHLPDIPWLDRVVRVESALPLRVMERFWPGPLTVVLPRRAIVPDLVTAGLDTVAIRMSANAVFGAVASVFDKPLAAPSANLFGRISPTTARHVVDGLGGRIPLVLDGGGCMVGLESTIVAIEGERLRILRVGPVSREELAEFGPVELAIAGEKPHAPGQLKSHYAPRTPLRLGLERPPPDQRVGLLAWRTVRPDFAAVEVLSHYGDLREGAATLFAKMRRLDDLGLDLILAEPVPEHGIGVAIMDRLRKAAA